MAKDKQKKKDKRKEKRHAKYTASSADRHELYELSVQNVEEEEKFLAKTFEQVRGRPALSLREDFCGTAALACQWIKQGEGRSAIGIDFDKEVLDWGRGRHVAKLSDEQKQRLTLIEDDVMAAEPEQVDMLVAFNFSYWIFKTRELMVDYFKRARAGLKEDGVFLIDIFGGPEAYDENKEKTKLDGFTYVWEQKKYDPISGDMECRISFKFPDGSRMKKAFIYEWRVWTLPELRELLEEAGFSKNTVYWEGTDEDGDGSGEYEPVTRGDPDPAWVSYIVAEK